MGRDADLDGFRIDTLKHVPMPFWKQFLGSVRTRLAAEGKNNFFQFGEDFDGDDPTLASYTAPGMLDSVFYFSQHYRILDVFQNAHDPKTQAGTNEFQDLWNARTLYGSQPQASGSGVAPQKALINFIDNHDFPRFLFNAAGDVPALRNALTFLLTEEGVPCMYYGTEQDFAGGGDPSNREVLWTTGMPTTGDTFTHIAKLTRVRKDYLALRRGDTTVPVVVEPHWKRRGRWHLRVRTQRRRCGGSVCARGPEYELATGELDVERCERDDHREDGRDPRRRARPSADAVHGRRYGEAANLGSAAERDGSRTDRSARRGMSASRARTARSSDLSTGSTRQFRPCFIRR